MTGLISERAETSGPTFHTGSLKDFNNGGYFYGAFMAEKGKSEFQSDQVEMAVVDLPEVDPSPPHLHEEMTEITYVVSGELLLLIKDFEGAKKVILKSGEFMIVKPGVILQNPKNKEGTQVFVVKYPSILGDKRYMETPDFERFKLDVETFSTKI